MVAPLRSRALTPDEHKALSQIARARKLSAGRVRRAQIILLSERGCLAGEIADELHIHERTVRRWLGRFNQRGLDGLDEGKRSGHPRVYSPQDVGVDDTEAVARQGCDLPNRHRPQP